MEYPEVCEECGTDIRKREDGVYVDEAGEMAHGDGSYCYSAWDNVHVPMK
jgi:hypothetical protein